MNILAIHVLQGQLQSHAGSDLRHVNDSMRRGRLKIIREYRLPAQPERWDVNQRAGLRAEIVFNWSRQGRRPYVQTAHDGALLLASLVDKTGGQHALVHCTQASGGG